jgi:hypothetical protein
MARAIKQYVLEETLTHDQFAVGFNKPLRIPDGVFNEVEVRIRHNPGGGASSAGEQAQGTFNSVQYRDTRGIRLEMLQDKLSEYASLKAEESDTGVFSDPQPVRGTEQLAFYKFKHRWNTIGRGAAIWFNARAANAEHVGATSYTITIQIALTGVLNELAIGEAITEVPDYSVFGGGADEVAEYYSDSVSQLKHIIAVRADMTMYGLYALLNTSRLSRFKIGSGAAALIDFPNADSCDVGALNYSAHKRVTVDALHYLFDRLEGKLPASQNGVRNMTLETIAASTVTGFALGVSVS